MDQRGGMGGGKTRQAPREPPVDQRCRGRIALAGVDPDPSGGIDDDVGRGSIDQCLHRSDITDIDIRRGNRRQFVAGAECLGKRGTKLSRASEQQDATSGHGEYPFTTPTT